MVLHTTLGDTSGDRASRAFAAPPASPFSSRCRSSAEGSSGATPSAPLFAAKLRAAAAAAAWLRLVMVQPPRGQDARQGGNRVRPKEHGSFVELWLPMIEIAVANCCNKYMFKQSVKASSHWWFAIASAFRISLPIYALEPGMSANSSQRPQKLSSCLESG